MPAFYVYVPFPFFEKQSIKKQSEEQFSVTQCENCHLELV